MNKINLFASTENTCQLHSYKQSDIFKKFWLANFPKKQYKNRITLHVTSNSKISIIVKSTCWSNWKSRKKGLFKNFIRIFHSVRIERWQMLLTKSNWKRAQDNMIMRLISRIKNTGLKMFAVSKNQLQEIHNLWKCFQFCCTQYSLSGHDMKSNEFTELLHLIAIPLQIV